MQAAKEGSKPQSYPALRAMNLKNDQHDKISLEKLLCAAEREQY